MGIVGAGCPLNCMPGITCWTLCVVAKPVDIGHPTEFIFHQRLVEVSGLGQDFLNRLSIGAIGLIDEILAIIRSDRVGWMSRDSFNGIEKARRRTSSTFILPLKSFSLAFHHSVRSNTSTRSNRSVRPIHAG